MSTIEQSALDQLAALLLERAGLKIAPDGYHGLRLALAARMPALGISDAEEYVRRLKQLAGEHELRSLLPLVTVGYTEFFRDTRQFGALERKLLPELLTQSRREGRQAAIWSAGCATGEEPYSLAMVLCELGVQPFEVEILATDLNLAAIENARIGRYMARRLAGLPEARVRRFFVSTADGGYEILPALREYIRFEGQNLAAPVFARVLPESLDLILCRNVIIYFDLPTIRGLMDRFLTSLRPGGMLLLGYSESLFKVYDRFEMVEVEGAFVYRRPPADAAADANAGERRVLNSGTLRLVGPPPPPPPPAALKDRPPAVRVTPSPLPQRSAPPPPAPARAPAPAPAAPPKPSPRSPIERLKQVVDLMERGNFDAALDAVKKLIKDEPDHLDALLTLGNLYSLVGRSGESMETFARAIAQEPLCVEARIFGGVAQLQAGKLKEAKAELSKGLFLEPTLALGHYLLAQVQEKMGDVESARRSYRNAIAQLRFNQRPLAGHYPDMPESPEAIGRAARYALSALEEN